MKTNNKMMSVLFFILVLNLSFSCEKRVKDQDESICIYKPKNDYSNNVPVALSEDNTKITSAPGTINTNWPVKLTQGYYLNGSMGVNTGYLSLTKEEYNEYYVKPGNDSLYKLLIDKDPYLEYYYRDDYNIFRDENAPNGIDTAQINDIIRKDELNKYFERLK